MDESNRERDLAAEVAAVLQANGYEARLEADLDGFQVDVEAHKGARRGFRRIVVECKAYTKLVGWSSVRAFGSVYSYLKENGSAHEGWLVTSSGFTPRARAEAERLGILALSVTEMREKYSTANSDIPGLAYAFRQRPRLHSTKRVFVIMPFTDEMNDVYVLGIRWVAKRLKVVAQRADDLQHNGEIIEEIQGAIREYDAVVGDTSGANPNVCYEIGFAHALNRRTVLICKRGEKLPFDLQGVNHVLYRNIIDLRSGLERRLRAALGL